VHVSGREVSDIVNLDLVTIMNKSLNRAGVAYLSACQTATGDENLLDKIVHWRREC
jgi:CHAT domain-containing protein